MENNIKQKNKLLIPFIIVIIIAILGGIGTFYFYNKNFNNSNENNNIIDSDSSEFTHLEKIHLANNETKTVNIGNAKLTFKSLNKELYFNDKKLELDYIYSDGNFTIDVTNLVILVNSSAGQFGVIYKAYDLKGNEINIVTENGGYQFDRLGIRNGKLIVDAFNFDAQLMEGYIIGDGLLTEPVGWGDCKTKLKDFPDIVKKYEDKVLEADYYFEYENNSLVLKIDKVKLSVKDLDENTCVNK